MKIHQTPNPQVFCFPSNILAIKYPLHSLLADQKNQSSSMEDKYRVDETFSELNQGIINLIFWNNDSFQKVFKKTHFEKFIKFKTISKSQDLEEIIPYILKNHPKVSNFTFDFQETVNFKNGSLKECLKNRTKIIKLEGIERLDIFYHVGDIRPSVTPFFFGEMIHVDILELVGLRLDDQCMDSIEKHGKFKEFVIKGCTLNLKKSYTIKSDNLVLGTLDFNNLDFIQPAKPRYLKGIINQATKSISLSYVEGLDFNYTENLDKNLQKIIVNRSDFYLKGFEEYLSINQNLHTLQLSHILNTKINDVLKLLNINKSITHLDLSDNQFDDEVAYLIEYLMNHLCLTTLILNSCQIQDHILKLIINELKKHKSIIKLELSLNKIKDLGCECLKDLLIQNKSLQYLNLKYNPYKEKGVKLIIEGLYLNKSLKSIDLNHTKVDKESIELLFYNQSITNFNTSLGKTEGLNDILKRNASFINLDKLTFKFDYNLYFSFK